VQANGADIRSDPLGEAGGIEPDVYITDPTTGRCSDLFNAVYELRLKMIAR
jgi:hypothetical protein